MMRSALYCCLVLLLGKIEAQPTCPDGDPVFQVGVSDQDRKLIVDIHNEKRDGVAAGGKQAKDGTLPPAKHMMKLVWDEDLAITAQKHANYCRFAHFYPKSETYDIHYGQNLGKRMTSGRRIDIIDWSGVVNAWYNEIKDFSVTQRDPYTAVKGTGHFSQVVWAESDRIGCGYIEYRNMTTSRLPAQAIYTCDYVPPGNVIGGEDAVYEAGEPCSDCKCDTTYTHLCV